MKDFTYLRLGDGIIKIDAPTVDEAIFLVEGKDKALLIDCGYGICSLKKTVSFLTEKPLVVVNTHGHPDHGGGNGEFDKVYLDADDFSIYHHTCRNLPRRIAIRQMQKAKGDRENPSLHRDFVRYRNNIVPLEEGHIFDLGDRVLRTFKTPGHTPGSICLYEEKTGFLFAGDTLASKEEWLFLPSSSSVESYLCSLEKIKKNCPLITKVFAGHSPSPVSSDILDSLVSCCEEILTDNDRGEEVKTFLGKKMKISCGNVSLIYNKKKIRG
jgi:hydroxyacylglutathione hydrolase